MPLFFRIAAALGLALTTIDFGTQAALAGSVNTIIVTTTADGLNEFDGQCSLREAIHNVRLALAYSPLPGECAAGSTTALNRIVLASGETYSLTLPWTSADSGRLLMEPNWESDQIQLRIETSAEAPATILQTVFGNHVFENSNARTELHNLIITGGLMGEEMADGAGIQNFGGYLHLERVEVTGNSALGEGGGVLNESGAELIILASIIRLLRRIRGSLRHDFRCKLVFSNALRAVRKEHPGSFSEMMEVSSNRQSEKRDRDATEDYPQSGPEVQVVCIHQGTLGWIVRGS